MASADVLDQTDVQTSEPALDDGDHDRYSHYVNKTKLTRSAVTGETVVALCGKRWVPNRDPHRFQVCPTCKEIYEGLRR